MENQRVASSSSPPRFEEFDDPAVVVSPWLDIPTNLGEEILERLPLSGYVRFAAVCRQWRSIQTAHRRRHAPFPPPMLSLPWRILYLHSEGVVYCYSPLEDRSYVICLPRNDGGTRYSQFTNGWLLAHDSGHPSLFNLISATKIDLPPRMNGPEGNLSSAVSPPPNYVVSIMVSPICVALLRWCDPAWSMLGLPLNKRNARPAIKSISCRGKHYYIFRDGEWSEPYADDLLVVVPLPTPTIQLFKMQPWGEQHWGPEGRYGGATHLVDFDGELLLVKEITKNREGGSVLTITLGYHVFMVDHCKKMWAKVESLGDRVLFLQQNGAVSLSAADVGLKRNCIYFSTYISGDAPWKVFDLGTEMVTDVPLPNPSHAKKYRPQYMFVPSIC